MQGLPFDDSDFPTPSVALSSPWIDQSPRVIAPSPPNPSTTVTAEDLYHIVGDPSSQSVPSQQQQQSNAEVIHRFSQQLPVITSAAVPIYASHAQSHLQHQTLHSHLSHREQAHLSSHHSQPNVSPPPPQPRPSNQRSQPQPGRINTSSATPFPHQQNKSIQQQQQVPTMSNRRQRVSTTQSNRHQPDNPRLSRVVSNSVALETHAHSSPTQQHLAQQHPANAALLNSDVALATVRSAAYGRDLLKKPARSAVEEARLRAQREAESFAIRRRDPTKREVALTGATAGNQSDGYVAEGNRENRASKRVRHNAAEGSVAEGGSSRKGSDKSKTEDDSEAEKQERYKRRLDMNRESAAVSRVRRRAYVKELEERLAAVEAEKLQLEGKLEIMQSQNDSFKKQLDNLFMMVATGRRPQYPPTSQEPS